MGIGKKSPGLSLRLRSYLKAVPPSCFSSVGFDFVSFHGSRTPFIKLIFDLEIKKSAEIFLDTQCVFEDLIIQYWYGNSVAVGIPVYDLAIDYFNFSVAAQDGIAVNNNHVRITVDDFNHIVTRNVFIGCEL